MAGQYGCSVQELQDLMEFRGREALEKLKSQYGGGEELCRKLKTSPTDGKISFRCTQSVTEFCSLIVEEGYQIIYWYDFVCTFSLS